MPAAEPRRCCVRALRSKQVRRTLVGPERDPSEGRLKRLGEHRRGAGLRNARGPFEEHVAVGEQRED